MITQKAIIQKLNEFLETEEGKRRVVAAGEKKILSLLVELIPKIEEGLKYFLPVQLQDSIGIEHSAPRRTPKGGYQVDITLTNVWRPSLDPDSFPEGVENIVLLFDKGYDTGGKKVRGIWEGHTDKEIWSLAHRDGQHFMQDFVDTFNIVYKEQGVTLKLSPEYRN